MKKIKKWYLVLLIIFLSVLAIGIQWLFNHPWIFEEKISVSEYEINLANTSWKWEKMERIWVFGLEDNYTEFLLLDNGEQRLIYDGKWEIDSNEITIKGTRYSENGGRNGDSKKRIEVLTENYLNTSPISPRYGAGVDKYYTPEELKKIKYE